ncbi:MAG TPA: hypothetical protein VFS43_10485 [Polyangiaceae bacterium]|nr:hypothetical protein [Polyangiaceae bacterium]
MHDLASPALAQRNAFLRSEIAAVGTCHRALRRAKAPGARATLHACARSHAHRVECLRVAIGRGGGTPASDSGRLRAAARWLERGARALGGERAVDALARGEDRGLRDYRDRLGRLDGGGRELVRGVLLPARECTRRAVQARKKTLSLPGSPARPGRAHDARARARWVARKAPLGDVPARPARAHRPAPGAILLERVRK